MDQPVTETRSFIYYRLIALWVLCEAMLGGIIHGLRIPVSGLLVGSCAVICISLIAWYVPAKGAIIKATLIVAIFKMMLSPQAPPPAYIAVFFQGLMGELLFWRKRFFTVSCFLLGVLALLESGLQRILVLTIVYGNDLWTAINNSLNRLTGQAKRTDYSFFIITWYVLIHVVAGVLVGMWAGMLPYRIKLLAPLQKQYRVTINNSETITTGLKRKKRPKKLLLIIWVLLILLYAQSYFKIGTPLLPAHVALKIFLRSVIIVLAWYFVIGPLVKQLLNSWLQKKKRQSQPDIQQVIKLLPATKELVSKSWQLAGSRKGWKRFMLCCRIILANTFYPNNAEKRIYILTGPIQTSKTTSLVNWSANREDVFGILTPVVDGKRVFMNAHTREQFPMESIPGETGTLTVGRFEFSQPNFNKAIEIIREVMHTKGWLVIDEIGPLELTGKGFTDVLKEVLAVRDEKILLVVREGLVEKVRQFFEITHTIVINDISALNK